MDEDNKITEIEFSFRCQRKWHELQKTENPDIRFCDDCRQNVHYVGSKLDFAKYDENAKCFAVRIYEMDRSKAVTIAGGIGGVKLPPFSNYPQTASFIIKFGPKSGLSESQLETIKWLRHFNAKPVVKDKMVELVINSITEEKFDRIISLLEKEEIPFTVE